MPETVWIALYVLAAWWVATGGILVLGRRAPATFRASLAAATVLLILAIPVLYVASRSDTMAASCLAFAATLVIWGWLEMSFLLGAIVGPRRAACSPGAVGWPRLREALGAILYHELATIVGALLVAALTWQASHQTGLWTYLLLWGMRISAKLNLYCGVPNTGEPMLPPHLRYLASFFRRGPASALFPLSLLGASAVCAMLLIAAWAAPATGAASAQFTLLATLACLAVFEHFMLVLPMRADAPWSFWGRSPRSLPAQPGQRR
jgi:putative photosynthetic complex assembly protein 2